MTQNEESPARKLARELALAAIDRKAERVVALDVVGLTSFADAFVLASGTSDRHVRAVADAVVAAAKAGGTRPIGVEGQDEGRWILIDLNDVVVHVFQAEAREHFDLDRMWEDAPRIPVAGGEGATPEQALS